VIPGNLQDRTILITGAAGFIGSWLGNHLKSLGNHVVGIDSYIHASSNPLNFHCEKADIRWEDLLMMRAKDVDIIVHLAAMVNVDFSAKMPTYVFDVNLDGTIGVLEVARRLDKPVVFASSSEIYGTAQERAMNERHQLDGQSPYAASKIAADRACKAWQDAYGMDIRVLRCFNTFGPWQADDGYGGVIAKFTKQALAGKPMTIYGSGEQRRDYLWVEDTVDAYVLALSTRQWPGPTNFGTGTTVSIIELAQNVAIATGFANFGKGPKSWYEHVSPRTGEVDCLRCDASKAREMGWQPKMTFQQGLKEYVTWAKNQ